MRRHNGHFGRSGKAVKDSTLVFNPRAGLLHSDDIKKMGRSQDDTEREEMEDRKLW